MKKTILFKLIVFLLPFNIFSQLNVVPNGLAAVLAQTIAGSGVTVTSASLNCGANAAGTFTYTGSDLGIPNGIILTTGAATDAANPGTYFCDVTNGNYYADPNLTAVDPDAYNDACILQFDFTPVCDTVKITFVFGSEEYPVFVGSFNDGFGIFLTGPKPGGGNYTAQDIGILPNLTPVSINNVNANTNSAYFHDNYTNPNSDIAYDGYTIPITSATPVVACSTYHMEIAIADALDEAYDSGVFIGGNAVSCTSAPVITATNTSSCGGNNGSVSASVTSYPGTPTYTWQPGGQTTATVNNLPAGTYTCIVGLQSSCASYTQNVITTITNSGSNLSLASTPQNAVCSGSATGSATVTITGGSSPYTVHWNTTPVQTGTIAVNLTPGTYIATVTDNSGCQSTIQVVISAANPPVLQTSNIQVCGNNSVLNAPAGTNYQWYNSSNTIISGATASTYSATGITNGSVYVVGYTDNTTGCRDSMKINITEFNISFNPVSTAPCSGGNNGSLNFSPASGNTFTSFDWNMTGPTTGNGSSVTPPISMSGLAGGTYTVMIAQAGNPSCAYVYTITLTPGQISVAPTDTIRVCNLDTAKANPSIPVGSINHWYTSGLSSLGNTSAGTPLLLYPPPHSGNVNISGALYIDSVKSAAGCVSVYKTFIKPMSFQVNVSPSVLRCHNDSIGKLKVVVIRENNGPINQPYLFDWIYPSPYHSPATVIQNPPVPVSSNESNLHAGTYTCVVKAGNCFDTVTYVMVNPPALSTDSLFGYYCPKDSLGVLIAKPGYPQYHWLVNNVVVTQSQNPDYNNDSIYLPVSEIPNTWVTYLKNGCPDTAKILISQPAYNAFIPTASVNIFTPNDDKINDFFYPFYDTKYNPYQIAKQADSYELHIYNRWGKLVFESTDYATPWDGKNQNGIMMDDGTYYYIAKYKSNCSTKADIVTQKGYVQLMK